MPIYSIHQSPRATRLVTHNPPVGAGFAPTEQSPAVFDPPPASPARPHASATSLSSELHLTSSFHHGSATTFSGTRSSDLSRAFVRDNNLKLNAGDDADGELALNSTTSFTLNVALGKLELTVFWLTGRVLIAWCKAVTYPALTLTCTSESQKLKARVQPVSGAEVFRKQQAREMHGRHSEMHSHVRCARCYPCFYSLVDFRMALRKHWRVSCERVGVDAGQGFQQYVSPSFFEEGSES